MHRPRPRQESLPRLVPDGGRADGRAPAAFVV
jgi:hypothetical protein